MYQSRNRRSAIWFLVVVSIFATAGAFFASMWVRSPGYYWFPFPFIFIPVVFLLFFGFRWFFWGCWGWGHYSHGYFEDAAMTTLRQRYAHGEITKEQLEQMTKDLEQI